MRFSGEAVAVGVATVAAAAFVLASRGRTVMRGRALRHVVQLAFLPGAPVEDICRAFDKMCMAMPDLIVAYERGEQCSPEPHTKGLTHIFSLTFPSTAARDQYLPHPTHEEFGRKWIAPYLKELCVSDYEIAHVVELVKDAQRWRCWSR
jgi:hypothetical protein